MKTYLKFLGTYLLMCLVFVVGSYYIITEHVQKQYFEQRIESIQNQLDVVTEQISKSFFFLTQVDSVMKNNKVLKEYKWLQGDVFEFEVEQELEEIANVSEMINSVVYMSKNTWKPLSTKYLVEWKEQCFVITDASGERVYLDPKLFENEETARKSHLKSISSRYLVYWPNISDSSKEMFFYILDEDVILSKMKGILSGEVKAVALIDSENNVITGINTTLVSSQLEEAVQNQEYLCIRNQVAEGKSLVISVDSEAVNGQISKALRSSILWLLVILFICFLLIVPAMKITYRPLNELVKRVAGEKGKGEEYFKLLEHTFDEEQREKMQLREELDDYRNKVQKMLLTEEEEMNYPYEEMNEFVDSLSTFEYQKAKELLNGMMIKLDVTSSKSGKYKNYYVQNVLINVLWNVINAMTEKHIETQKYNELYKETLNYVRSEDYALVSVQILDNLNTLLDVYEKENSQVHLTKATLMKRMEEHFCKSDFSITTLADEFQLTVPNMSLQFKLLMGETFSELLWKMRVEKAKILLVTTDISIEEIVGMVGYYSRTSFVNKFSKTVGMTPSQFRKK